MKNLLKFKVFTILFLVVSAILAAYCVDRYIIEIGTTLSAGTLLSTMFANGGIIPWIKNDKFVAMTDADIKELEVEKLSDYHKALAKDKEANVKELIEGKTSKEYVDQIVEKLNTQLAGLKKSTESTELKDSIEAYKTEMQKQIDEAGVAITKLQDGGIPGAGKTLKSVIMKALEHDEIKDFYARGEVGASKGVEIDLKDVTMGGFTNDVVIPSRRGPQVSYLGPKKFDIRDHLALSTKHE